MDHTGTRIDVVRRQRNALAHWSQVTTDVLSKRFKDARDAGASAPRRGTTPPTFHEVRSLGGRLLEEQGSRKEYVRLLMRHGTMKMTDVYLDNRSTEVKYGDATAR